MKILQGKGKAIRKVERTY